MFTNRPGCTVWEKVIIDRSPTYVRHEFGAVYYEPHTSMGDGKDRAPRTDDFFSVPEDSADYLPKRGDRIVDAVIANAQPPAAALTIEDVKDLRYGSKRVRHIELRAG